MTRPRHSVWRIRAARHAFLGSLTTYGTVSATLAVMMAEVLNRHYEETWARLPGSSGPLVTNGLSLIVGGWLGRWLGRWQPHPRRRLALIPLAAFLCYYLIRAHDWTFWAWWLILGLASQLLLRTWAHDYAQAFVEGERAAAIRWRQRSQAGLASLTFLSIFLSVYACEIPQAISITRWILLAVWIGWLLASCWIYRRELVETLIELLLVIMHRMKVHGSGKDIFPQHGPVLVIANHACWMDPFWLGKVLPRTLVPMIASNYYDHRWLHWILAYIFGAIRVHAVGVRREAPELTAAIAALDRGECVMIFPEGRLRREDQEPMQMFKRGIWRILAERPKTPVVVCWIEGSWGSFFSYKDGLPTKNKPFDLGRPIDLVISEPICLDEATLADHRQTRLTLMKHCVELRKALNLPEIELPKESAEVMAAPQSS